MAMPQAKPASGRARVAGLPPVEIRKIDANAHTRAITSRGAGRRCNMTQTTTMIKGMLKLCMTVAVPALV